MESNPKYKRVLIKLSGEFLKDKEEIISFKKLDTITSEIKKIQEIGVKIGLVLGGGNILRGLEGSKKYKISSAELDELGMTATLINGGAVSLSLKKKKVSSSVLSAIPISSSIGSEYIRDKALNLLEKEHVVIFVGGTGNPYFTTDTAAVLRALQINADILLKVTNVDGVYDKDPNKFSNAKLYKKITYKDALSQGLKIMDLTAFSLAMEHDLPLIVFNGETENNLSKAIMGNNIGTIIKGGING